jgi:hypothetical protein
MSSHEILWRISEKLRVARERRLARRGRSAQPPSNPVGAKDLPRQAARFLPGAHRGELAQLAERFPEVHARLVQGLQHRLAQIDAGTWNCLGQPCDLRGPVDWSRDPVTGHRWPLDFYDDLPVYDLPGGVDVKQVWELGRHQFLFTLGAGWLVSGDERHAAHARRLLLDWIQTNPLYLGVHWTSALEPGMRVISWMWTLAALSEWSGWSPADLAQIATSLEEHGTFLAAHFSLYSSPYNHLIGEAAALYLLGLWMDGPRSAEWRRQAADILLQHGPKQFHPDGVCVEQAMGYQFYTLMFLTLAWCAAGPGGGDLAPLESLLRKAWSAAAAFQQSDGLWPPFGDIDSARTVPVLPEEPWDFSGLCGLGAALFTDPASRAAAGLPGAELFWLRGTAGVEALLRQPATEPAATARRLADSGYAVFRSPAVPGDWLLVDGGPIAGGLFADATPSTAHGHADLLQLLVHVGGEPFLVDSGMSTYGGARELVDAYRDAWAHNTLQIEGAPVARHAGRLGWSHVCPQHLLEAADRTDMWLAHVGCQPSPGVFADRYVLMIPGVGLWLADHVRTPDPRRVDWSFQLAERAGFDLGTNLGSQQPLPTAPWPLWVSSSHGALEWSALRGSDRGVEGWRGREYGVRFPGTQLRGHATCPGELVVMFAFTPGDSQVRGTIRLAGRQLGAQPASADAGRPAASPSVPGDGWSLRGGGWDCDLAWGPAAPTGGGDWEPWGTTGWRCWRRRVVTGTGGDVREEHTGRSG